MFAHKRPIFWLALLVWGIAMFLSASTVWAVSGLDARTWPALSLDPAWTGEFSEANQWGFVTLFIFAYLFLVFAGLLWGRVFVLVFGRSGFARIALMAGILSLGSFVLWAAPWRITFWLEDMGFYLAERNAFENLVNFVPLGIWILGGMTFFVFSIFAANDLGKR
ncbi:MAG: hypothetical protein RLY34_867 [Actinomycetota bacterium]|jgi:hypothetical protein